ncbi:MAG: sigma-54 dependent transcriptional regulator [Pseudomonadales bacterium]|nr:sigma-54 dependent transcriptional regulator [Pseudomonadales bacterium]
MRDDSTLLIVDDDEDILTAGKLLLQRHYARVDTCADPELIPELIAATDYAAILLDMNFGPGESSGAAGLAWLQKILLLNPDAVVVLITAHGDMDMAVEAMKIGATDFIAKPWQNEKLVATLSASVKLHRSRREASALKKTNTALMEVASNTRQPMLGESTAMQEVQHLIERTAPTQANVLILGENGTGKELAARALHNQSARREHVFVTVDLGAISETLFESELFGHVKGSFTDAKSDRIGRLQAARGGTLFLDEIGNLPLHLQAKLLSVLEQKQVVPVGASKPVDIDIRIIAATNVPREQLTDEQRFRQDLLFRLNTVEIIMPPLRERREDISAIAVYYADLYTRKYGRQSKRFSSAALAALTEYDWPGNVRALRHALERAVILSEADEFVPEDFSLPQIERTRVKSDRLENLSSDASVLNNDLNLEALERKAVQAALTRNRYNISHAAKDLGLTRAALYRRMEKHGL